MRGERGEVVGRTEKATGRVLEWYGAWEETGNKRMGAQEARRQWWCVAGRERRSLL